MDLVWEEEGAGVRWGRCLNLEGLGLEFRVAGNPDQAAGATRSESTLCSFLSWALS
jgi:hypothetical protein